MTIEEIISSLELLKAEIEWDKSIEYQITLDETIKILRKQLKENNKVIDEFVEKIILKYYGIDPDELCKRYGTIGIVETIKEIAEQIKGEYNT